VLPITGRPLRDALIAVDDDRIVGLGLADRQAPPAWRTRAVDIIDLGHCAVLPGVVNAHTHLELSWMRDLVPPGPSMPAWASRLIELRGTVKGDAPAPIVDAIRAARAAGTALVGDVTNTLAACGPLAESALGGAVFREVLGFRAADPERLVADAWAGLEATAIRADFRRSVVPHAPYSVSPALFGAIAAASGDAPLSVHVGESAEELRFLRDGTGPWRDLLARLGAWTDAWQPPACGPVEYLDRLGLVSGRLIAVHGTQLTRAELLRLEAAGSTVVACPRSNRWTGAGVPPIEAFYESGVRVAVGTDSLASVEDLDIFHELTELRRLAPAVPAARLLDSATLHGARALGLEGEYGSIEPGKRAALIAVDVPSGVDDVEEYLVGGIGRVRWLAEV
jgi:cytosine/adenosine deaminase-related metal-dependent hydrolase